jgi:hypothetical protein
MYQMSGTNTTKNPTQLKAQHRNVYLCFAHLKSVVFNGAVWLTTGAGTAGSCEFGFHEMRVIS